MSPNATRVVALLLHNLGKTLNYDKDQSSATNTSILTFINHHLIRVLGNGGHDLQKELRAFVTLVVIFNQFEEVYFSL